MEIYLTMMVLLIIFFIFAWLKDENDYSFKNVIYSIGAILLMVAIWPLVLVLILYFLIAGEEKEE